MLAVILLLLFLVSSVSSYFDCPKRCQCYEDADGSSVHLICKWDELNTTNLDSLRRPEAVRTLTIRCPHFSRKKSTPPAGLFRGLRNLDRLEIERCVLTSLPGALLSGLHQLYSLIIKNAKLPSIPDELFRHTPNLMTLDLTGNELRIEPYSLSSLRNLIHLDLSNNSIAFLTNTLISLTKLNVLTMDSNRLTNIDFRRLPEQLTDLSLRNNFITTLHYVPQSARNLRRIDLSGNQLEFLAGSGSVNMLPPALKQVDLMRNRISFIQEGTFAHMPNLALLDLKQNRLSELREESLVGPQTRTRLFLEGNQFQCHCSLRWMLHATTKTSPVVLDLPTITCSQLLDEGGLLNLTVADQLNLLICKYETLCSLSCTCCDESTCSCRSSCPSHCRCYRSADVEQRNARNILVCEKLRIDHFDDIPESTTELRIDSATWKRWDVEKFKNLRKLNTLRISNTSVTEEEINSLGSVESLSRLQLIATGLNRLPTKLGHLTHLQVSQNPLSQLTSDDLKILNSVKRLSLGGNSSSFTCDCQTPSPLQLWLREKRNRDKVEDVDSVMCYLPTFGSVPIVSTLPSNESVCREETIETTRWIDFVTNIQRNSDNNQSEGNVTLLDASFSSTTPFEISENTEPTSPVPSTSTGPEILHRLTSMSRKPRVFSSSTTTVQPLVTSETTVRPPFTTPRHRRKYSREDSSHEFLNALIFILFVCVLILVVTIAFTLYYRFIRIGRPKHHKHPAPEAAPLNATSA